MNYKITQIILYICKNISCYICNSARLYVTHEHINITNYITNNKLYFNKYITQYYVPQL
jgi:hypothetical protein